MDRKLAKIVGDLRKISGQDHAHFEKVADELESLGLRVAKLEAAPAARRAQFRLIPGGRHHD